MKSVVRSSIVFFGLVLLLCGVYPLAVTLVGNLFFLNNANGSLIIKDGKVVGSSLIGQSFTQPQYFQGRLSAAGNGYDAANSSGSNLGPTSKKLHDRVKADVERVKKENPSIQHGNVPTELVTASGSGLDPHISPRAAVAQVPRVALARNASEEGIEEVVKKFTEGPQLGVFGEPTVNVLLLNIELDRVYPVVSRLF